MNPEDKDWLVEFKNKHGPGWLPCLVTLEREGVTSGWLPCLVTLEREGVTFGSYPMTMSQAMNVAKYYHGTASSTSYRIRNRQTGDILPVEIL